MLNLMNLVFMSFKTQSLSMSCRSLDSDLGAIMKAGQTFEWERIPFVLEAWGLCDFISAS